MALLDLLGRRWALRVLWELRETDVPDRAVTFRELRALCDDVSPTVLNQRLHELRESGVIEQRPAEGYALTAHGVALLGLLQPLDAWAKAWARRATRDPKASTDA